MTSEAYVILRSARRGRLEGRTMRMRREFRFVRRAVIVMPGEDRVMARNGFKLIDAEMHVMEPTDLWQRYIDPEFRTRAPRRLDERRWDIRTLVEGEVMAQMPGGDWPALSDAEETALATRYAEEIARNFDPNRRCARWIRRGSIWRSSIRRRRCM